MSALPHTPCSWSGPCDPRTCERGMSDRRPALPWAGMCLCCSKCTTPCRMLVNSSQQDRAGTWSGPPGTGTGHRRKAGSWPGPLWAGTCLCHRACMTLCHSCHLRGLHPLNMIQQGRAGTWSGLLCSGTGHLGTQGNRPALPWADTSLCHRACMTLCHSCHLRGLHPLNMIQQGRPGTWSGLLCSGTGHLGTQGNRPALPWAGTSLPCIAGSHLRGLHPLNMIQQDISCTTTAHPYLGTALLGIPRSRSRPIACPHNTAGASTGTRSCQIRSRQLRKHCDRHEWRIGASLPGAAEQQDPSMMQHNLPVEFGTRRSYRMRYPWQCARCHHHLSACIMRSYHRRGLVKCPGFCCYQACKESSVHR
jgi:hypothetical protein